MSHFDRSGSRLSRIAGFVIVGGFLAAVAGCGGGSSNNGGGGGNTQTYSLGGTINGLTTAGLVLSNGSDTLTVASGTANFTLPTKLPSGSSYAVSVSTQPSGQTCTVASGTGTIGSANVANVVVTCSTQSYSLGGTINGLNNSGLVLANGTDTLSVNAGASTFTMPMPVAFTSSYTLTVKTQPPGLACTIANGTGTMPGNAVTNVAITCTDQPFTVGGSIIGLGANTGLVLTNGTDTLTVAANATTFTMPTPVAFGSPYAVTASSSPVGLTCSVSNGAANMPANNVTNIVVTCSDQSYTVGGTISGLTTSGLILSNGSDMLTVPSGSTTFTMPAKVAYTSTYTIAVATQPAGLTCNVTSGTAPMGTANVTNVSVTCAPTTYTIGGSITGLTAGGLVLLNNAGDATTISANATQFTMSTGMVTGSTYLITVGTQPSGLTCAVTGGSGPVSGASVSTVVVTCVTAVTYTVLHTFNQTIPNDGKLPNGGLIQASDGNLYGAALNGGLNGEGMIYKMTTTGTLYAMLYSFDVNGGGENPNATLIQASGGTPSGGTLYGTTLTGGSSSLGAVFSVTTTGTQATLFSFTGPDGQSPNSNVIQGRDGLLYGTTLNGGANGKGVVYQIDPTNGTEIVLYSFGANATDANAPYSGLVETAVPGTFYGTTALGGANNQGTIYQLTVTGSTATVSIVYSFTGAADGGQPYAGLTLGADTNYYGTTVFNGPDNGGAVFSMNAAGAVTVLHTFTSGSDGANPYGGVIRATDGNLYGVTKNGGTHSAGTIFKVAPDNTESVLYSFTGGTDGGNPFSTVIQGTDGSFYGTTTAGGDSTTNGDGVVFNLTLQ